MGSIAAERPNLKDVIDEKVARYRREWEERYSSLIVGRAQWKYTAWAALAICAGQSVALWNTARTPQKDLYVLERSGKQTTYAGPVKPVNMDDSAWDEVRVEALKKFIAAWRTVTSDAAARNLLERCHRAARSTARHHW